MPNEVSKITDRRSFFYVTTLFLLKYKDLGFISIWSPTILSLIFENFFNDIDLLLKDLAEGKINQNILMEDNIRIKLERRLGKNPKRTKEIKKIIAEDYNNIYEKIWPKMKIISCWADGNSRNYLKDINKYFPHTRIQEKGLLSTEALVSFPFGPGNKKILSFRSHFFEFVKKNKEKVFLTHELSEGKEYVVEDGDVMHFRFNV